MASLKEIANCIGLADSFWIVKDFYGYRTRAPKSLSLLEQMRLLGGKHIHVNLIRVGIESFTPSDERKIDRSVRDMRDIYATVDLGVGRVERFFITTAEADGRDNIDSTSEAQQLTHEWTVPNDAVDAFFVLTFPEGITGLSAHTGSCDKNDIRTNGCVVSIEGARKTLAHEVGHYLGLEPFSLGNLTGHSPDEDNLMFFNAGESDGKLTSSQGEVMRGHCFVKDGC